MARRLGKRVELSLIGLAGPIAPCPLPRPETKRRKACGALPLAIGAAALLLCVLAVAEVAATAPADARFDRAVIEALIVGAPMAGRRVRTALAAHEAIRRDAPRRRRGLVADGARRVVGEPALQHRARVGLAGLPAALLPDPRVPGRPLGPGDRPYAVRRRDGADRRPVHRLGAVRRDLSGAEPVGVVRRELPGQRVPRPRRRARGHGRRHHAVARAARCCTAPRHRRVADRSLPRRPAVGAADHRPGDGGERGVGGDAVGGSRGATRRPGLRRG